MSEKEDLIKYASENFGVDLDKRKGIKNLRKDIEALKADRKDTPEGKDNGMQEAQEQEQAPKAKVRESAQALADRIWSGQSASLSRHMRITRIIKALKDKAYDEHDIENLRFPE